MTTLAGTTGFGIVDDWQYQSCWGEIAPDPHQWRDIRCYPWQRPYDIEGAAEVAVENHLYDGADHPDCGYVDVWIRPTADPEAWMLFRVDLDFDITFSARSVSR